MNRKLLHVPVGLVTAILALIAMTSLAGAASAPQPRSVSSLAAPKTAPLPVWLVTWTATGTAFSDVTDSSGTRTVTSRKVTMYGAAIQNQLSTGGQDSYPFAFIVNDEETKDESGPCQAGGWYRHDAENLIDPGRYNGGPDYGLLVGQPMQRADGSWYMLDPFVSFYVDRVFTYRLTTDAVYCGGDRYSSTDDWPLGNYGALLGPGDINGDAQGKVFTKSIQFSDSAYANPPLAVQWNVTVRRLEGRDLTVRDLEVTQGLQDEAGTESLVRGRRTVVRAYLDVGADRVPVANVTGKLTAYNGSGTVLGSVAPFNRGGRITAPVWPDWQQIDQTLNFELPYAWTLEPVLRLEVEVNPDHSVAEINYDNNKRSTLVDTQSCTGMGIAYVPIHYAPPGGYTPADPSGNIVRGQEFLRKIFPVPDKALIYYPQPVLTTTYDINTPSGAGAMLVALAEQLLSSSAPRADHIYGWLPSLAFKGNGLAPLGGGVAFGNDTESPDKWRRTFAHELGHNFRFLHDTLTTAGTHWFDVYDRVIKLVPASLGGEDLLDFMVPERLESEAWISQKNYEQLVGQMCGGGASAAPVQAKAPQTADTLLVTGIISNTAPATGTLDPLFKLSNVPTYTLPVGSQYCVRLKVAASATLGDYCFDESFEDDSATPAPVAPFAMVVPYPLGLNRVELYNVATLLGSRTASAHPPTVALKYPNAIGLTLSGIHDVVWTGSDLDGDALTYTVLYSRDNGATWMGIGSGITGGRYSVDFSGLPGTTGASGRIKVMVSDGFYSAESLPGAAFTIANKPPTAVIISPPDGADFTVGPKVVLEGMGVDLEDKTLGDSALSWTSSKDGALGTGQLLEANLSVGTHTITLTAKDSGGLTATATIQVSVSAPTAVTGGGRLFLPFVRR